MVKAKQKESEIPTEDIKLDLGEEEGAPKRSKIRMTVKTTAMKSIDNDIIEIFKKMPVPLELVI